MLNDNKLRNKLSERINIREIQGINSQCENDANKEELYRLAFDNDHTVSWQALWVMTHWKDSHLHWLSGKTRELSDAALRESHSGKRRLLLSLIEKLPPEEPLHVELLDFCLNHMYSRIEPPSVQCLCMKIAFKLCKGSPELLGELCTTIEIADTRSLPPSLRATHRNVLKAIYSCFRKNIHK